MIDNNNQAKSYISALTIDVEDGINILMRDNFNIMMQPTDRVVKNVETILELLDNYDVKATFFILGEVAESYPHLVKRINSKNHEIGIHGYYHDQVFKLNPEKLRIETSRAKSLIENLIGKQVYGYRAPAFSINQQTSWALEIIADCGFKYDSSVSPAKTGRYGWNGFIKNITKLKFDDNKSITEVPLSVANFIGKEIPVCGGGYLRYFPYYFTKQYFKSIQKKRPVIVYLHPYELDVDKYPQYFYKAKSRASLKIKLSLMFYRLKKATVKNKLEHLLNEFQFLPLNELIRNLEYDGRIPEMICDSSHANMKYLQTGNYS